MTQPASATPAQDRVLILDFGSQFTQLIARRVRESGVYCEIMPAYRRPRAHAGVRPPRLDTIGRPGQRAGHCRVRACRRLVFDSGLPVLGICYGQQAMCAHLGGEVSLSDHQEFGSAVVDVTDDCELFHGAWSPGGREQVWMSHGDRVTRLPQGLPRGRQQRGGAVRGHRRRCTRRYYGTMFHPEVVHTPHGRQLLANFTHRVAGLRGGLEHGRVPRRAGRAHPGAGRHGPGDLRPVGRGGQLGRGGADP